ncbi:MAG: hypothetical protein H6978_04610 [Gammaproteobacteria bacterium]|nr:hypothetical protein [Gammaproteobacteria bacterium]
MITRTAIFEGRIKPGYEQAFFRQIEERLAPLWWRFPKVMDVRMYKIDQVDEGAPPIIMIQQVDYPDMDALAAVMTSPERDQARALTLEILQMFEGRFYHLVSEGNGQVPRP